MGISAGSAGTYYVSGSGDVAFNSPVTNHALLYDSAIEKWKNVRVTSAIIGAEPAGLSSQTQAALTTKINNLISGSRVKSSGIVVSGDSIAVGQFGSGTTWPNVMSADTGVPSVNPSEAGRTSADLATKMGGLAPRLTITSNTIPAGVTAVVVTIISPSDGWRTGSSSGDISRIGSLCGIRGTLSYDALTGDSFTFTRDVAGSATPCPSGSPFYSDELEMYRPWDHILATGRNNISQKTAILRDHDSEIAHMISGARYLVVTPTVRSNSASDLVYVKEVEAATLAKRGADNTFNLRTWLSSTAALSSVSLTADADDLAAIDAGFIPPSLSATDGLHLNNKGYAALGHGIGDKLVDIGWA